MRESSTRASGSPSKSLLPSLSTRLMYMEGLTYLLLSMLLVNLFPFRLWSKHLGMELVDDLPTSGSLPPQIAKDVRRTIRYLNRRFPGRFTCLMQAVAGKLMLNRRGIPNVLVLGVYTNHDTEMGIRIEAHAWLSVASIILLGDEVYQRFTPIARYYSPKSFLSP